MEMISERTALIKMCPGGHISRRAVQHLYPLEIESDLGPNQKAITLDKDKNNKSRKEVVDQTTTLEAPRRSKRKPKPLKHQEFVYHSNDSENEEYNYTAINKPKSKKLSLVMKAVIGLMFILLFINQSIARPIISPAVLHETVLTTDLNRIPIKAKSFNRKKPLTRRYRIKSRNYVTTSTIVKATTPLTTVITTPPYGAVTVGKLVTSTGSKVDFFIDSVKPRKSNLITELRIALMKPTTVAPRDWATLGISQSIRTTSSRTTV